MGESRYCELIKFEEAHGHCNGPDSWPENPQTGQMSHDPTADVSEGETVSWPDSEAGGRQFHLVLSVKCLERNVPEVG